MKSNLFAIAVAAVISSGFSALAATENPQSVKDLLNRIGGDGTADRFITVVDDTYASPSGAEMFKISARDGKPCITGTTLSALTTGIGWYLNHTANVNLAWNNPYPDLTNLPLPAGEEEHTTAAEYRYYLNYCTFSYSMSTWTWDRWQQEIDWMALHGINMPLQIVGLEEVWRKFLMEDCGYSQSEVNDFVAGPSFMAWFGMNNLQGHGGPNPDWWYERQAQLGKQMNERMRSLGMEPVLPGFYQVPANFASKTGLATLGTGSWCGFTRPHLVSVDDKEKLKDFGSKYYKRLHEVMGQSQYYSMDPFHEGGVGSVEYAASLYQTLYDIMNTATPDSKWVIQQWQWSAYQKKSLDAIPMGKLIVLDLNSERVPNYNAYKGHDTVFSTIFNFGGRTGFDGRFNGIINEYFKAKNTASVKGIGAAPEAIEQTPVLYDLLFELPWMSSKPDAATWLADYTMRRYGADSPEAKRAWELLRNSALALTGSLQGPHEAIVCSRPALNVDKVSSWGGADIFYDRADVVNAAYDLLDANLTGLNYSFDLTDIARQALTDYAKSLLAGIKEANDAKNTALFNQRRDAFLQLILDLDKLLNTNSEFMLGHWTKRARAMADEIAGTTDADRDWLELNNARTIITTWSFQEAGGLRDYSYREWGGMLKDFYYQRWKIWFDNGMKAPNGGWFNWEWNWAHSNPDAYDDVPAGDSRTVAAELMPKYLSKFTSRLTDQAPLYIDRLLSNDYRKKFYDRAAPQSNYAPEIAGNAVISKIIIDLNQNGLFEESETQAASVYALAADAPIGERNVRLELTDGTVVFYTVKILVDITEPRTVSVKSANAAQGSVEIVGTNGQSVTNTEVVTLLAKPALNYDFDHWTDADGNNAGTDNPLNYYGKNPAEFTAHFVINKWGVPTYNGNNGDLSTMKSYQQYIKTLTVTQGGETVDLYTADACPEEHFIQIPTRIKSAPGQEFSFGYTQPGTGMRYLYLSAYCDFDQDGTFDTSDELLGTIGTRNAENNAVGAGKFTMMLPYDAKKGTTHIRLRFDSAWGSGYDADLKAFLPTAPTNRIIYELILEVTDAADFVSEVTVKSSDTRLGTVRSENETTNLYAPGDEVIMTGFPNPGVKVARWIDNHGRELPAEWIAEDGNSVNFKAFDNAQITCIFEAVPLTAGDFTLDWEPMTNGQARIIGVAENAGFELDLSKTEVPVGAVESGALDQLKKVVATVVLPDATFAGNKPDVFFSATHNGDGNTNTITKVNPVISGSDSWVMTIEGTNDGSSFNEWGSALYGNGTNCLADDYSNGWSQFYLAKDGTLTIKWDCGNSGKLTFNNVKLLGSFSIVAEFDAATKKLTVTASANGTTEVKEISNKSVMKDISQYATAIPKGMNYTLTFAHPNGGAVIPGEVFSGFSMLLDYKAAQGNSTYRVKEGIVYSKSDSRKVVGFPEGRLFVHPFTVTAGSKALAANPTQTDGNVNDESLSLTEAAVNDLAGLWLLESTVSDKVMLRHLNSGMSTVADFTALHSSEPAEFGYALVYGSTFPQLALDDSVLSISEASGTVTVTSPSTDFAITLPFPTECPDGVSCHTVSEVNNSRGCTLEKIEGTIPAFEPIIVRGSNVGEKIAFQLYYEMPVAETHNLLRGTTVELTFPGEHYLLNSEGNFVLQSSGNIPANSAYLLKSDLPENVGDSFALDSHTVILDTVHSVESNETEIYDLQGRRVNKAARGLYIINGNKTIVK